MKSTHTIDRRKLGSTVKSLMGGKYMKDNVSRFRVLAIAFGCLLAFSISARGAEIPVHCEGKGPLSTIQGALRLLNPLVPNTLIITGVCQENVVISGFSRLTLKGKNGATINDASGGNAIVVDIEHSTDILLQGFTINGGAIGVFCSLFSVCQFDGNIIQGATVAGVQFVQSRGTFGANTIQNNGNGVLVFEASSVHTFGGLVIQDNSVDGVNVDYGSSFQSAGDTIRFNNNNGIALYNHGFLFLRGTTVSGNSWYGVAVLGHSSADFDGNNIITGNAISGVLVRDLSFAEFRDPSTVTGNASGLDVECAPQSPVAIGLTNIGGGATNCPQAQASQVNRGAQRQLRKPAP